MTQICAILSTHPSALSRLQSLMGHVDVAAVIIKPLPDGTFDADAERLVSAAQGGGAAALIWADVDQVSRLGADGVHIPWSEDVLAQTKHSRAALGDKASVGADAQVSRHDAMELGEAGADYVAFSCLSGAQDDRDMRAGLVGWWAEVFEPPVVALGVCDASDAAVLSAAGADFVGIDLDEMDASAVADAVAVAIKAGNEAHQEAAVEGDGA